MHTVDHVGHKRAHRARHRQIQRAPGGPGTRDAFLYHELHPGGQLKFELAVLALDAHIPAVDVALNTIGNVDGCFRYSGHDFIPAFVDRTLTILCTALHRRGRRPAPHDRSSRHVKWTQWKYPGRPRFPEYSSCRDRLEAREWKCARYFQSRRCPENISVRHADAVCRYYRPFHNC